MLVTTASSGSMVETSQTSQGKMLDNAGGVLLKQPPGVSALSSGHSGSNIEPRVTAAVVSPPDNKSSSAENIDSASLKPFFIMDWLEQVDRRDLAMVQQMLQEPNNDPTARRLFGSPSRSPSSTPMKTNDESPFRRRSVELGNGWNAKGLQKAKLGAWEEALSCWENALEIRTQVLGLNHLDVANTHNNMGIAMGKLGRIDDAVVFLQKALKIRTEHYGGEHTEVAATLHNIGNVLQQGGDLESAVECFCESKRLQEKLLGPNHVQVARACIAMGHTYYHAMEYKDAREAYGDALSIFKRAGVPIDNVEVQNTIRNVDELNHFLADRA